MTPDVSDCALLARPDRVILTDKVIAARGAEGLLLDGVPAAARRQAS